MQVGQLIPNLCSQSCCPSHVSDARLDPIQCSTNGLVHLIVAIVEAVVLFSACITLVRYRKSVDPGVLTRALWLTVFSRR
jgi:hypothetical protein